MRTLSIGAAAIVLMLGGCTKPPDKLVAGSKLSLESSVLGEILAQHVQNKLGIPVQRRPGLQGSMMAQQALLSGEIDLYAEDSGTACYSIFRLPINKDLDILNSRVALEYQFQKIRWIAPLGYSSTFVVVASKDKVKASSLSQLADADNPESISFTLEFSDRVDGFAALMAAYKLRMSGPARVVEPNQVADQVTQTLAHIGVVSSVDPALMNDKLRILEDDKKAFAGYPVAIVVKERTLANNPSLEGALKLLEGKLSLETMRTLNNGVKTQGKTAAAVAAEFLQQAGLK